MLLAYLSKCSHLSRLKPDPTFRYEYIFYHDISLYILHQNHHRSFSYNKILENYLRAHIWQKKCFIAYFLAQSMICCRCQMPSIEPTILNHIFNDCFWNHYWLNISIIINEECADINDYLIIWVSRPKIRMYRFIL